MKHGWFAGVSALLVGALAAAPAPAEPLQCPQPTAPCLATHPPCPTACAACCCPAADEPSQWVSAEYLLWRLRDMPVSAPLVSTGALSDPFPGVLGQPGTQVLFGNSPVDTQARSGIRLRGGAWLEKDRAVSVEGGFFYLADANRRFNFAGGTDGTPVLGHPFINANTGNENLYIVSVPASVAGIALLGRTSVSTQTWLGGYDVNLALALVQDGGWRFSGLVGYRGLIMKETLNVTDQIGLAAPGGPLLFLGQPVTPPARLTIEDSFRVHNRFYGGQVGGDFDWSIGRFHLGLRGQLGLGVTDQIAFVNGSTATSAAAGPPPAVGGTYAQQSNIGRHYHRAFGVVPEVGVSVAYAPLDWLYLRLGYTFLYWNSVSRPGNLIDRTINPNLVPSDAAFGQPGGDARPTFGFRDTAFWAHGLSVGAEVRF